MKIKSPGCFAWSELAVTVLLGLTAFCGVIAFFGQKARNVFVQVNTRITSTGSEWSTSNPQPNPNAYYANTYLGGQGTSDRVEKLIADGASVSAQEVKLAAFPRRYGQAFRLPRSSALALSADLERPRIINVGDTTFLQVGLQAIKREAPRRSPLNVALVLDVSGSMGQDNKLTHAKRAAAQLVDRLTTNDVLALVVFDNNARVVVAAQKVADKELVKRAIENLTPGSGTNIYDGLTLGYRELAIHHNAEVISRMFLLSDGETNVGITDPAAFRRLVAQQAAQDTTCTSIGVGLEFNQNLMMSIAEEGKGNYHFLKDAANAEKVFRDELHDLMSVVARALRLRVHLADGVELVKVFGAQALDTQQTAKVKAEEKATDRKAYEQLGIAPDRKRVDDEPGMKTLIPHFYHGDSHVVTLQVRIPGRASGAKQRKIADVYLQYKDLVFRKNQSTHATVSATYADNRADMIASAQPAVVKNRLGFEIGEALIQSARAIEQGNVTDAVRTLDERMVVLGVAAREWKDKDLDHDGELLAQYKTSVASLNRSTSVQLASNDYLRKSLTYAGYRLLR